MNEGSRKFANVQINLNTHIPQHTHTCMCVSIILHSNYENSAI